MDQLGSNLDAFHDLHGISIIEDLWTRLTADVPVADVVASVRGDVGPHLDDKDIAWSVTHARKTGLFYEPVAFWMYDQRERPIAVPRPWPRCEAFGLIWREFLRSLLRGAENHARTSARLPRVGEGLVSEVRLLNELRKAFPDEVVNHQVRPTWLAPQSLDIVFAGREVAVEYQGDQHSRPIEFFGGEEAFENQQGRDAMKRFLCRENGMHLIEVFPGYALAEVVREIRAIMGEPPDGPTAVGTLQTL